MARCWQSESLRVLAVALGLFVGACEGGHGSTGAVGITPKPAPAMVGKTIDGEPFELAALRGTVVLVNVWATWCAPCREELPELKTLHETHAGKGFTVVGVSIDRASQLMAVRQMVDSFALPYPIVFDPLSQAIAAWDIKGYPTSFLVDRSGNVRWRRDGIVRPSDPELAAILKLTLDAPK